MVSSRSVATMTLKLLSALAAAGIISTYVANYYSRQQKDIDIRFALAEQISTSATSAMETSRRVALGEADITAKDTYDAKSGSNPTVELIYQTGYGKWVTDSSVIDIKMHALFGNSDIATRNWRDLSGAIQDIYRLGGYEDAAPRKTDADAARHELSSVCQKGLDQTFWTDVVRAGNRDKSNVEYSLLYPRFVDATTCQAATLAQSVINKKSSVAPWPSRLLA